MKNSLCIVGLLLYAGSALGQNDIYAGDAFRYSEVTQTGTARMRALGGNHASLGGDASSVFGNPAGLGFYNRSELSLSPSLNLVNTEARYLNQTSSNTKGNPNIVQFGLVLAGNRQSENRRWQRTALGITYNRQNSFANLFSFQGRNSNNSIVDSYVEDANSRNLTGAQMDQQYFPAPDNQANFASAAAYQLYLIDPVTNPANPNQTTYNRFDESPLYPNNQRYLPTDQRNTFSSSGATSQWTIAYAGNLDNKLYVGGSIALTRIRYDFDNDYRESLVGGQIYRSVGQTDNFSATGNGINLSLGLIYKLDPSFQIGVSATTPTFYSVKETFNSSVFTDAVNIPRVDENGQTVYFTPDNQRIDVVPNNFEYSITSPFRASAGATYFLGASKIGFITASVDYVGYQGMRASTDMYNNVQDNNEFKSDVKQSVQSTYNNAVNFRVGAEVRAGFLRFRGGVAYLPDPYKQAYRDIDRDKLLVSAGVGVRNDRFFTDLSGTYNTFKTVYSPYSQSPSAQINNQVTNVTLSAGVFF
ncbi:hypothetical protein ACFQ4C_02690 [Larkinella insperata]|uniref:Outer membrane protein transport protein (OMPP1/FadL/TodX) n=1 Tax=Larkinella insperata TaxID=332158 RepID=A0ABW3Q4I5_9BACT|nr:hypothetical protein [Larkinella insperata]